MLSSIRCNTATCNTAIFLHSTIPYISTLVSVDTRELFLFLTDLATPISPSFLAKKRVDPSMALGRRRFGPKLLLLLLCRRKSI